MRLIDADEAIINFGFEWDDISPTRDEFVSFLKSNQLLMLCQWYGARIASDGTIRTNARCAF